MFKEDKVSELIRENERLLQSIVVLNKEVNRQHEKILNEQTYKDKTEAAFYAKAVECSDWKNKYLTVVHLLDEALGREVK